MNGIILYGSRYGAAGSMPKHWRRGQASPPFPTQR